MSPHNKIQVVTTEKLPDYIAAKREGNPTIVFTPSLEI
jgi:hypothetical protein